MNKNLKFMDILNTNYVLLKNCVMYLVDSASVFKRRQHQTF